MMMIIICLSVQTTPSAEGQTEQMWSCEKRGELWESSAWHSDLTLIESEMKRTMLNEWTQETWEFGLARKQVRGMRRVRWVNNKLVACVVTDGTLKYTL